MLVVEENLIACIYIYICVCVFVCVCARALHIRGSEALKDVIRAILWLDMINKCEA